MAIFPLYLEIMNEEGVGDEDVAEHLELLSDGYSLEGLKVADSISFDSAAYRAAYLYLYGTCHTRGVMRSLSNFKNCCEDEVDRWKTDLANLKICSIGGGPGCDIVGFLLFLKDQNFLNKEVSCTVVDKYEGWESTYDRTLSTFPIGGLANYRLRREFIAVDLLRELGDDDKRKLSDAIGSADCVIMNKFVSSVAEDGWCKPMLEDILGSMKIGGLLFFIDNSGGKARFKIQDIAEKFQMREIYQYTDICTLPDEQVDECKERFGYYSKRSIDIITIVWKNVTKV